MSKNKDTGKIITEELIDALFRKDEEDAIGVFLSEDSDEIRLNYGIQKPKDVVGHNTTYTALHAAVLTGNIKIAEILLNRKASPNIAARLRTTEDGELSSVGVLQAMFGYGDAISPFQIALESGNRKLIELLLKYEASFNNTNTSVMIGKNTESFNCLHAILLGGEKNDSLFKEFQENQDVYGAFASVLRWEDIDTPIIPGTDVNGRKIIEGFLRNGIDINYKDKFGQTLLHKAGRGINVNIINHLIEYGADASLTNMYGNTPFSMAVFEGRKGIIDAFGDRKTDINSENVYKESIAGQFEAFGRADETGVAFSLARKGVDAIQIYNFSDTELKSYLDLVQKEARLLGKSITRRFAYLSAIHDTVGIVRTNGDKLEIIVLDSLVSILHLSDTLGELIKNFPNATIYVNQNILQANGPGCTIFSEEWLEKLDNSAYFPQDLFAYAESHRDLDFSEKLLKSLDLEWYIHKGKEEEISFDFGEEEEETKNVKPSIDLRGFSLPPRLIRSIQKPLTVILPQVPEEEKGVSVDKSGKNFFESLEKHLDYTNPEKPMNRRLEHWLEKLHAKNWEVIQRMSVEEIEQAIESHSLTGYEKYMQKLEGVMQNKDMLPHQREKEIKQLQQELRGGNINRGIT